jgi:hypothetical protein
MLNTAQALCVLDSLVHAYARLSRPKCLMSHPVGVSPHPVRLCKSSSQGGVLHTGVCVCCTAWRFNHPARTCCCGEFLAGSDICSHRAACSLPSTACGDLFLARTACQHTNTACFIQSSTRISCSIDGQPVGSCISSTQIIPFIGHPGGCSIRLHTMFKSAHSLSCYVHKNQHHLLVCYKVRSLLIVHAARLHQVITVSCANSAQHGLV